MFEAAELGRKLSKDDFRELVPPLRVELLKRQFDLREADFSVVVLVAGDDRLGTHEVFNRLHEWLDARLIDAYAFGRRSDEERERPAFWRYWRKLPAKGRIGVLLGGWTANTIGLRLRERIDDAELERYLRFIRNLEKTLDDNGILLIKLWLHLPKKKFKKQLKAAKKDPELLWNPENTSDGLGVKGYKTTRALIEKVLRRTSVQVPWHVVESSDHRYRDLTVSRLLLDALTRRLDQGKNGAGDTQRMPDLHPARVSYDPITILDTVDLTKAIPEKSEYQKRLEHWQEEVRRLTFEARRKGIPTVLVFEGWDAGGKGSTIRRLTSALDATGYRVIQISAPTEEELAHHYLWRFWSRLPPAGRIAIFDRSWYGRVLVERVEGYASENEWRRAYAEINDFEEQLTHRGIAIAKFWLHIDPDEQLRRFKRREKTPFKKFKITEDDYRNRERWNDYELAANEMIERTSTEYAPWHLIPANDKRWARVEVIETLCKTLEKRLD